MNKEKIKEILNKYLEKIISKTTLIVGGTLIVGLLVGSGISVSSYSNVISEKNEAMAGLNTKIDSLTKTNSDLSNKLIIAEKKITEAKPWFDMKEQEKQQKEAEEKAQKEKVAAEEKAKKEQEEKAIAEASAKKEVEVSKGVDTTKVKKQIESIIKKELNDQVKNTKLDSITINENLGTESDKDVVTLAYLSWSEKNGEKTTRDMLKMYSEHLAATLAEELENGSEIALFWKAEYTGLDIKHSYSVKDGKAYMQ